MPTARRGTLEPAGTWPDGRPRFRGRLRLGDGSRSGRFDVPEGLTEKQARSWLAGMQVEEDARGLLLAKKLEAQRERARERGEACEGEKLSASAHANAAKRAKANRRTRGSSGTS